MFYKKFVSFRMNINLNYLRNISVPSGSCTILKVTGSTLTLTGGSYALQATECDDPQATRFTFTFPKSSTGVGFWFTIVLPFPCCP